VAEWLGKEAILGAAHEGRYGEGRRPNKAGDSARFARTCYALIPRSDTIKVRVERHRSPSSTAMSVPLANLFLGEVGQVFHRVLDPFRPTPVDAGHLVTGPPSGRFVLIVEHGRQTEFGPASALRLIQEFARNP
jgi:hypothetical protein